MLPNFEPQIVLAFIAAIFTATAFSHTKGTRFHYKTYTHLSQGFIYAKSLFIMRLVPLYLCLIIPLSILFYNVMTHWDLLLILSTFAAITALIIAPELHISPNAKLVITKPLLSHTAILHLKAPYQGFDKQTYQELFTLVEYLPRHGVNTLSLTSPMFYNKQGQLRSLKLLEKGLNKRGARLSHSPAGVFDCLLGKISMLLSPNKRKKAQKSLIDLLRWHNITLHLGTEKERDAPPKEQPQTDNPPERLQQAEMKLMRQILNAEEGKPNDHDNIQLKHL